MVRVGIIQISVPDMDRGIEWYCDVLGFKVASEHYNYPVAVDLVHEGCRLLLHRTSKAAQIDYPNVAQTLICIQTDDIITSMNDLKDKDVELVHESPQKFPAGLYAAFKDPFGNVHELVEFK
ncbi:MAG: VOC family protein [Thermoplasmata archaeon]|nr:MAG: VOC family protein [Thermoplasmata archaeon]